jgi:hypothetical protein
MVVCAWIPAMQEAIGRRIRVQTGHGQNARPYLKNNLDQMAENLLSKHKALSSNSSMGREGTGREGNFFL